jgi:hypothetical protein
MRKQQQQQQQQQVEVVTVQPQGPPSPHPLPVAAAAVGCGAVAQMAAGRQPQQLRRWRWRQAPAASSSMPAVHRVAWQHWSRPLATQRLLLHGWQARPHVWQQPVVWAAPVKELPGESLTSQPQAQQWREQ